MFLVVFVTLVISIIGLFVQIVTLQTAKLNQSQLAFMQNMATWENAGIALARSSPPSFTALGVDAAGTKSCSLTATAASPAACMTTNGTTVLLQNSATPYSLPAGYQTGLSFASVAYSISSMATQPVYVITYVASTDAHGFVIVPDANGTITGETLASVTAQFMRGAGNSVIWGTVVSPGNLHIQTPANTSSVNFTIPYSIPTDAVAIVSSVY